LSWQDAILAEKHRHSIIASELKGAATLAGGSGGAWSGGAAWNQAR